MHWTAMRSINRNDYTGAADQRQKGSQATTLSCPGNLQKYSEGHWNAIMCGSISINTIQNFGGTK